ncbi:hypothetical protein NPIL_699791 [Nephila pilipes]|uniref:Uncharacterized protein n=1 Tax=Nephila pilipes TaxID=299642 RepID=A0A8X6U6G7_NEPPI|nr:hypothetical protein NPIL_699791 [Nephila pilipes]
MVTKLWVHQILKHAENNFVIPDWNGLKSIVFTVGKLLPRNSYSRDRVSNLRSNGSLCPLQSYSIGRTGISTQSDYQMKLWWLDPAEFIPMSTSAYLWLYSIS